MTTLTIAFCPEGPTDGRFLSSVIQRTAADLLSRFGSAQVDVLEPTPFERPKGPLLDGAQRLLAVARETRGFHCLIIHADADDASPQRALAERIGPARALIVADPSAQPQQVVALVPVTMTEAWMLADTPLLQEALDTDLLVVRDLGLPHPNGAETVAQPKEALRVALQKIQAALPPRRRQPTAELLADLYGQLAEIPLPSLRQLPSFLAFEASLYEALTALSFVATG